MKSGRSGPAQDQEIRLASVLDDLDLPDPFKIEELLARVSKKRGRPIHLHTFPAITGDELPCGAWLATDKADHILVEDATSPLHRDHIVLHEVSHMLLRHTPRQTLGRAFHHLDPDLVMGVLGRTSYETEEERSAETLAGLIATRAALRRTSDRPTPSTLRRLNAALSDT
ncbi:hypothetical protein [Streptomyces griseoluteus]|uniref:hypothetical protein n=1 Tax=Streptomyces griseoluteus TaxID=29306 RepID=UPI0019C1DEDF|nr:hypothetical protein [Streptomyces griseoluteus]GHE98235.1 hypothetical protein GCM10017776_14020 [Streptomyces griseoluteus]